MVDNPASRNSTPNDQPAAKKVSPKRGRWLSRCLFLLVLIGMIGWFAPTICATTELRNQLPKLLLPAFTGTCALGETSLGWFSPINIKNIRVTDDEGQTVLEVGQLSTTKPLWALVAGGFGTFKIVQPVLHARMTDHDSNIERLLARLFGDKTSQGNQLPKANQFPKANPFPELVVEIENGRIELEHAEPKSHSTIERISLRVGTNRAGLDELNLLIGDVPESGKNDLSVDWFAVRFGAVSTQVDSTKGTSVEPSSSLVEPSTKPIGINQAVVKASHWKLDRWKPLLSRFLPNDELDGELDADATLRVTNNKSGQNWDWNGSASLQKLLLVPKEAILRDRLQFDQVSISGRAMTTAGRIALNDFKVTADVGQLSVTGDCSLDIVEKRSLRELIQSLLSNEDYHLKGNIDLKKLAVLLPQTLRIRDGIEITSGDVRVEFVGVDVEGVRRWSGTAEIAGLNALNRGQKVSWEQPISWRTNAHRDRELLVIDMLECKSDFLQIIGKGTFDDARFTASGDLSKLSRNVEQFVDLGLDQLSGQMKAKGEIKRSGADHVSFNSKMMLDDFAYVVAKESAWREKHLELSIVAEGQMDDRPMLTRVETAEVHLKSANDAFDLVLQQPIEFKSTAPVSVAKARVNGELTSWQNRLRPFLSFDNWKFVGLLNLSTDLSADPNQIAVSQLKVAVRDFVAESPGWLVKDPEVTLETSGKWDQQAKTWTSPKLVLNGKAVAIDISDLDCSFARQGISKLVGSAVYRADLVQLSSWKNLAIPNPSYYLIGSLSGSAKFTQQDRSLTGQLDAQVEKLVVAGLGIGSNGQPQWLPLWKEPRLKLTGQGSFNQPGDLLTLDSAQFGVEGFSVGAQGKMSECSTNQRFELAGQLSYDWETLRNRFGPQAVQEIQMSGKDKRSLTLKGSLASLGVAGNQAAASPPVTNNNPPISTSGSSDLSGQAGLGWTSGNLYGLKVGAGDVQAQIEQGVCRFAPIDLAVNDGKLHLTPTLYLDRSPYKFVLPQEKTIDRVSLSRDLCNSWLKFVAPMLAECAQVDGTISLDLRQASFLLGSGANGSGEGVLTVHSAQARPGPLAMQIVQSIDQVRSIITLQQPPNGNSDQIWMEMPEQTVPVKLEQGRMYHDGLTFIVANITVKTSGSVGLDSSLNLVAQIPLKDDWLGNKRLLKGKSIQIPIAGTIARPMIDPRYFANLAQQLGGSFVDGLLQDKAGGGVDQIINNGLDKLFKGNR